MSTPIKDTSTYGLITTKSIYSSIINASKSQTANTFADLIFRAYNTDQSKYVTMTLSAQANTPKLTFSGTNVNSTKLILSGIEEPAAPSDAATKNYIDTHAGSTSTHGVTGNIVGTGGAQTLSSKTLNTSTITAPYGSSTTPSYGFDSSTNTGIYGAANTLYIGANGVEQVKVDTTSTKISSRLDIVNTQIRDSSIRINNGLGNAFSVQNSGGTTTYLKIDVNNDKVTIPRNPWSSIYILVTNLFRTVVAPVTFENVSLGLLTNGIAVISGSTAILDYDDVNGMISIVATGVFLFNITLNFEWITNDNRVEFELMNPDTNNVYCPIMYASATNGLRSSLSTSFIASVPNARSIRLRCKSQNGNFNFTILSYSFNATNMLIG